MSARRRTFTACAALAALGATLGAAPEAKAQRYLVGGDVSVASGAEGGGRSGLAGVRRARTRVRIGAELRVDESPEDIFGAGLLAELEPRASVGADVRYARALGKPLLFHIAALGYVAPETLLGAGAGVTYRLALGTRVALTVGGEANFFLLGTDIPDNTVLWQTLVLVGLHVDL